MKRNPTPGGRSGRPVRRLGISVALGLVAGCGGIDRPAVGPAGPGAPEVVRVATFNVRDLSAEKVAEVDRDGVGTHPQLRAAAAVIREIRPDILLLNEVDVVLDAWGRPGSEMDVVVRGFQTRYLEVAPSPVHYPYVYVAPVNAGFLSGHDLDQDGIVATEARMGTRIYGEDAYGFGMYPGQHGMAVLSRFPLAPREARTFRTLLWQDLPGHHIPDDFYPESVRGVLRLSSTSHWDLPVVLDRDTLHLFASHPTSPVFDGPENRNGRRNFDEIGFWSRYLDGHDLLYDDQGRRGGFDHDDPFVILGDLSADPFSGDAVLGEVAAVSQLLDHPRVRSPAILGTVPTTTFGGGTRVDYVLPSVDLEVVDGGVFAPPGHPDPVEAALAEAASDHRIVWLDLRLPERR